MPFPKYFPIFKKLFLSFLQKIKEKSSKTTSKEKSPKSKVRNRLKKPRQRHRGVFIH